MPVPMAATSPAAWTGRRSSRARANCCGWPATGWRSPIATPALPPDARRGARAASAPVPATPAVIAARMAGDPRRPRSDPAGARAHRRLDLPQPAGHEGLGTDRRRRLPGPDAAAMRRCPKSTATSCSTPATPPPPISRGWAKRCAAACCRQRCHAGMGNQAHRHPRQAARGGGMTRVAVLYGGMSAEREVSLVSRRAGRSRRCARAGST